MQKLNTLVKARNTAVKASEVIGRLEMDFDKVEVTFTDEDKWVTYINGYAPQLITLVQAKFPHPIAKYNLIFTITSEDSSLNKRTYSHLSRALPGKIIMLDENYEERLERTVQEGFYICRIEGREGLKAFH